MSAHNEETRRLVAELDAHVAEVEAIGAALKTLLAGGQVPEDQDDEVPAEQEDPS